MIWEIFYWKSTEKSEWTFWPAQYFKRIVIQYVIKILKKPRMLIDLNLFGTHSLNKIQRKIQALVVC